MPRRLLREAIAPLMFLVLLVSPGARAQESTELISETILYQGRTRTWLRYVPASVAAQEANGSAGGSVPLVPLVIGLHGGGETPEQFAEIGRLNQLAEEQGFVVAYPRAVRFYWNDGREDPTVISTDRDIDDAGFISTVIVRAMLSNHIDPTRVYLIGHSNGAMMALRFACERADEVAAVGAILGSIPEKIAPKCVPSRTLPLLLIAGTEDPLLPWDGGDVVIRDVPRGRVISVPDTIALWRENNGCGDVPAVSELPDTDPGDGTTISLEASLDCDEQHEVRLYRVNGGGHRWPGAPELGELRDFAADTWFGKPNNDIDAARVAWEFLEKYDSPPRLPPLQTVTGFRAQDGGCPMNHCTPLMGDFQRVTPPKGSISSTRILDPSLPYSAGVLLGCTTGEDLAVCGYNNADLPGLVAYDYRTAQPLWTSPLDDFPLFKGLSEFPGRLVLGILAAKVSFDGRPEETRIFAANPSEIAAYDASGVRLWKRSIRAVSSLDRVSGVKAPLAINFSSDGELVMVTRGGWIVKLEPSNGQVIDAYRMDMNLTAGGQLYEGRLISRNAFSVVGNVLYFLAEYRSDWTPRLNITDSPAYMARVELSQPGVPGSEKKIKPLALPSVVGESTPELLPLGFYTGGGTPTATRLPDGRVLITGDADRQINGKLRAVLAVAEDNGGVLSERWYTPLATDELDTIAASPATHPESRTMIVSTVRNFYVFRGIDQLQGLVPLPAPLNKRDLITCGAAQEKRADIRVGSPVGLAFDASSNELVAYTNFKIKRSAFADIYGYLGAFTVPLDPAKKPRALWCMPLAIDPQGRPAPGRGTSGQSALFEYEDGGSRVSGLIVNTVNTGTFIFKSLPSQ